MFSLYIQRARRIDVMYIAWHYYKYLLKLHAGSPIISNVMLKLYFRYVDGVTLSEICYINKGAVNLINYCMLLKYCYKSLGLSEKL